MSAATVKSGDGYAHLFGRRRRRITHGSRRDRASIGGAASSLNIDRNGCHRYRITDPQHLVVFIKFAKRGDQPKRRAHCRNTTAGQWRSHGHHRHADAPRRAPEVKLSPMSTLHQSAKATVVHSARPRYAACSKTNMPHQEEIHATIVSFSKPRCHAEVHRSDARRKLRSQKRCSGTVSYRRRIRRRGRVTPVAQRCRRRCRWTGRRQRSRPARSISLEVHQAAAIASADSGRIPAPMPKDETAI